MVINMAEINTGPSAKDVDWSRELPDGYWDPGRRLLKTIRQYQLQAERGGPVAYLLKRLCVIRHMFWSVVSGADIPLNSKISGGLRIPHPNGIVIHPDAEIGPNCMIFQQVTVGANNRGIPKIGGNVMLGAGAKVLGGITLGDNVRVGANAVVVHSVADGKHVVGVPAKEVVEK